MATRAPRIELRLQGDRTLYLSRKTRLSPVVFLTLSSDKPVVFVKHYSGFDVGIVDQLITQCIECIDAESGEMVPVLAAATSRKPKRRSPYLMTLYDKMSDSLTFTTATTPREYEFAFETYTL